MSRYLFVYVFVCWLCETVQLTEMKDSNELRKEIATLPVTDSIIVAAGPGSGKTKLLIDRLVFLCKNTIRPNSNIACITLFKYEKYLFDNHTNDMIILIYLE
jgi:hypothetical protein